VLNVGTALRQGVELLERGAIDAPRLTAEVLLAHALHSDRTHLYAHPERELREVEWIHYGRYLHERLRHKPLQYITGKQEFYGRDFRVTPDVLIPRPETELLVETALPFARSADMTVDVGTGSGAIAITLALEGARRVVGLDISDAALAVARTNGDALNARVEWVEADGLSALADRSVGLIVSNPPYVAEEARATLQPEVRDWEPSLALFADADGLTFYRRLIPESARVLQQGGGLVLELGAGQSHDVAHMLDARWSEPRIAKDLAGIDRILYAELRP
jgi:release factor glutamine methyltransferase